MPTEEKKMTKLIAISSRSRSPAVAASGDIRSPLRNRDKHAAMDKRFAPAASRTGHQGAQRIRSASQSMSAAKAAVIERTS